MKPWQQIINYLLVTANLLLALTLYWHGHYDQATYFMATAIFLKGLDE